MKRYLSIVLLLFASLSSFGQENITISLLTVEPRPNEVYTIFGHTALRVVDASNDQDVVFNWGTFDFTKPNFIYYFMKGETDYFLSVAGYNQFYFSYASGGSTIIEQELNLNDEQKQEIMAMLAENWLPQNRFYLYNFLFDNCTTRVRDIIQKAYGGDLQYDICFDGDIEFQCPRANVTFRDLIHSCTEPYPWLSFGIDLIIGNGADSLIHLQQEMFLPERLMYAMDNAYIINEDGQQSPVVISRSTLMEAGSVEPDGIYLLGFLHSPLIVGIIFLCIFLVLIYMGIKKKITFRIPFALLFLLAAAGGAIVAFLVFLSIHPCVSPNWNLLWLHPLHLVAVAGFCFRKTYPLFYWYHILNFVLLCGLLLAWFLIPQQLPVAAIPYILILAMVSGFTVYQNKETTTRT